VNALLSLCPLSNGSDDVVDGAECADVMTASSFADRVAVTDGADGKSVISL